MNNFAINDQTPSLLEILKQLSLINDNFEHTLGLLNGQQLNQLDALTQIGFVKSNPPTVAASVSKADETREAEPALTVKIMRQITQMKRNNIILEEQVDRARFIGDSLFQQVTPQDKINSVAREGQAYTVQEASGGLVPGHYQHVV